MSSRVSDMQDPTEPIALSSKQLRVVQRLVTGATDKQIAEALGLSPRTVSNTLAHVYNRTGVSSRAHLTGLLLRGLLVEEEPKP